MSEVKSPGRPREFDEDEALDEITKVFWAKGYEGTSMADLLAATGLNKGSLYGAFGDKRAQYLKSIARYDRTAISGSVDLLRRDGDATVRIALFLQSAIDAVKLDGDRRGCFLCSASADQAALDADSRKAVLGSLGRLERALEGALSEGKPPIDPKSLKPEARHLLAVYVGLRVLAKAGTPIHVLEDAKRRALRPLRATD